MSGEGGLIVALLLGFGLTLANPWVASAGSKRRKFYLTQQNALDGSQALTACVDKYHMASIWEILDVTNLSYALELGPAIVFTRADQGSGPPSNVLGWVRTGGVSSTSAVAGSGNCNAAGNPWTSNNGADSGTLVLLPDTWTNAGTVVAPWVALTLPCDALLSVWCVADK